MDSKGTKGFMKARADLQAACLRGYPIVQRQVEAHRHTFIWQMDKGLESNLFGTPIEKANSATLTADQVRRIARENGKSYSQACMAITPKILSLSSSIERLADGELTIQEELNCFRSLVERLAVLETVYMRISDAVDLSTFKSFDDLIKVRGVIASLIGTRFNWSDLQLVDFPEMPAKTDYSHDPNETRVDLSAKGILNQVDKLQKRERYRGIRPFYNFCCEFVHPNIGDILAATAEKRILMTHGGQFAYKTKFEKNPLRTSKRDSDFFIMFSNAYTFATMLINEVERVSAEFGTLLNTVKRVNKKHAHKVVKKQARCFSKDDYCPCGSGRSIRACAFA